MEATGNNFAIPLKMIIIHAILYPLSFVFDSIHFSILLKSQYKSFFISCYIIESLLFIFLLKMIGFLRSSFESKDSIMCNLLAYASLSVITLVFVIGEYALIFKNFNIPTCDMEEKYKILFVITSLLYHIYNNLIFICELIFILKSNDKKSEPQQIQQPRNIIIKRENTNKTSSSEKPEKEDSFVKEDTIFIIQGQVKDGDISSDNQDKNIYEMRNSFNNNSCANRNIKNELFEKKKNNTQAINLEIEEKKEKLKIENNGNKTVDNGIIINNKIQLLKINPIDININNVNNEFTENKI